MPVPALHLEVRSKYPDLLPLASLPLSPLTTAASFQATDATGWNQGRFGYVAQDAAGRSVAAYLPEPVAVEDGAILTMRTGNAVLYEGVVMTASDTSITCEGLGLWAPRWGQVNPGGAGRVTMGTIVGEAFETCPWLSPVELVDTGVQHAWSELQHRTLGDAINQMLAEGGIPPGLSDSVPWMFLVYEDGLARLVPKLPAAEPDYVLSYDPATMQVQWTYDIVDAVRIAYTESGVARLSPWFYRGGVDHHSKWLRRETLIGQASTNGAVQVAQTYLAQHSTKQLTGSLTFSGWEGMQMRAGETVKMLGFGANDQRALISTVNVDLFSGVTQVTLGQPDARTWQGFLRTAAHAVRSLGRQRNYITGATG